jgi:hypothetical protein
VTDVTSSTKCLVEKSDSPVSACQFLPFWNDVPISRTKLLFVAQYERMLPPMNDEFCWRDLLPNRLRSAAMAVALVVIGYLLQKGAI